MTIEREKKPKQNKKKLFQDLTYPENFLRIDSNYIFLILSDPK